MPTRPKIEGQKSNAKRFPVAWIAATLLLLLLVFWRGRGFIVPVGFGLGVGWLAYSIFRKVGRHPGNRSIAHRETELSDAATFRSEFADLRKFAYGSHDPRLVQKAYDAIEVGERLQTSWQQFEETLNDKLSPTELTYQRYHGTARSAFNECLEQLRQLQPKLLSLSTIAVEAGNDASEARKHYLSQLQLVDNQLNRLNAAHLALVKMTTSMGDLRTVKATSAGENIEQTITELNELAERTKKYSLH